MGRFFVGASLDGERGEFSLERVWIPRVRAGLALFSTRIVGILVVIPVAGARAVLVHPRLRHLAQLRDEREDANFPIVASVAIRLVHRADAFVHAVVGQRVRWVDLE